MSVITPHKENSFLWIFHTTGLDGSKVAVLTDNGAQLKTDLAVLAQTGRRDQHLEELSAWWDSARVEAEHDSGPVSSGHIAWKSLSC